MKTIKIRFSNGLTFKEGVRAILRDLTSEFIFEESSSPDFVVFGPYGTDIPTRKRGVVTIGYFCENIRPDMSTCDWAFGVPYEEEINHPRYMRIDWHGFSPNALVKKTRNIEDLMAGKTRFCNFIYANPVPYRERFFRELSKYKPVDAPGKSMNNMPSIDSPNDLDKWTTKRRFLSSYKFTIAFENYSYPGYHTEKILDPMVAGSVPIYFGNPRIAQHFNPRSFINAQDYVEGILQPVAEILEKSCRLRLMSAAERQSVLGRGATKLSYMGQHFKMRLQCWSFSDLIEQIVRIDRDESLYAQYLTEPWFHENRAPSNSAATKRWKRIFSGSAPFQE